MLKTTVREASCHGVLLIFFKKFAKIFLIQQTCIERLLRVGQREAQGRQGQQVTASVLLALSRVRSWDLPGY